MNRNILWMAVTVVALTAASALLGLSARQLASVFVFVTILCGTLFYWQFRLAFAFIGLTILLAGGLIDIPHIVEYAGLDIIFFLIGMMTVIGFLEENRFFEHVIEQIITFTGKSGTRLMVVMMSLACLSAALVDEVTSILFMAAAMLHLTKKYRLNPKPFILMLVFTTNIGSSATVVGNPIGVLIALRAGFTFADFLRWAAPISALVLLAAIGVCLLYFSKDIQRLHKELKEEKGKEVTVTPIPAQQLSLCWLIFVGTVAALVCHHAFEEFLGIEKNSLLLGVSLAAAGIVLLLSGEKARELVEKRVDWWTLSFFLALFATVGTLKLTGVTSVAANKLAQGSGDNYPLLFTSITWTSGLLSAFLDNVLAVATFVPILGDLKQLGIHVTPLWWGILFGCTLGGNLTIIGSTANIVAAGMLERRKEGHFSFLEWVKPGLLVVLVTLVLATLLVYLQIPLMPK